VPQLKAGTIRLLMIQTQEVRVVERLPGMGDSFWAYVEGLREVFGDAGEQRNLPDANFVLPEERWV
jgi:hypothetical protein